MKRRKDSEGNPLPVVTEGAPKQEQLKLVLFLAAVCSALDKGYFVWYDAENKRATIQDKKGYISHALH